MNKYVTPNKFDKILISSDYEADIFKKHGFKDDKFIKVGLPRWDLLRENNPHPQKSILFMFTWRRLTQSQFDKSYYKKNLLSLLRDSDLHEYLTKYDVHIYFAPHHALKHNSGIDFDVIHPNIKIVDTTEISKQIKQSSMLVTDYSSIVFDFIFQDKPAILYVLDDGDPVLQKQEQIENQLLKTKQDKLPNILFSKEDVVNKIKYYVENNFKPEEESLSKYQKFFYTKDNIREKIINELEHICK